MSKEESRGLKTRNGNGKSKEVKKSHGESRVMICQGELRGVKRNQEESKRLILTQSDIF